MAVVIYEIILAVQGSFEPGVFERIYLSVYE